MFTACVHTKDNNSIKYIVLDRGEVATDTMAKSLSDPKKLIILRSLLVGVNVLQNISKKNNIPH